jgi:hypothetical protein
VASPKRKRELTYEDDASIVAAVDDKRLQALANSVVPHNDADGYARAIGKLWGEAQEKFIAIGRHLVLARRTLPHGEYQNMVDTMLPFGSSVARKLRTIAEAVCTGRMRAEALPLTYSVAYELAVLPDQQLQLAEQRQLIRPDVTRREIDAFKRELRQPSGVVRRRSELLLAHKRTLAQIQELQTSLAEIEAELAQGGGPIIDGDAEAAEGGGLGTDEAVHRAAATAD